MAFESPTFHHRTELRREVSSPSQETTSLSAATSNLPITRVRSRFVRRRVLPWLPVPSAGDHPRRTVACHARDMTPQSEGWAREMRSQVRPVRLNDLTASF